MKTGDLVLISPTGPDIGVYLGPADSYWDPGTIENSMVHPLHRSSVMFDNDIYSIPTFQLEIISEDR